MDTGWTYALQDYIDMNIMSRLDDPNMVLLQQMEDPYFYKDRLTMPKMVVNAVMVSGKCFCMLFFGVLLL